MVLDTSRGARREVRLRSHRDEQKVGGWLWAVVSSIKRAVVSRSVIG